jgi:hypothetical protein
MQAAAARGGSRLRRAAACFPLQLPKTKSKSAITIPARTQVTRSAVRLLVGPKQAQHIPLPGLLSAAGHPSAKAAAKAKAGAPGAAARGVLDAGPVHIRFAQARDARRGARLAFGVARAAGLGGQACPSQPPWAC